MPVVNRQIVLAFTSPAKRRRLAGQANVSTVDVDCMGIEVDAEVALFDQ